MSQSSSRKLQLAMLAMVMVILIGLMLLINPLFVQVASTLVSGIVAIFGIYCTGNVVNKYAVGTVINKNPALAGQKLEHAPKQEEEEV